MIDTSDWMSGFIGFLVFLLGLIPLLEKFGILQTNVSALFEANWFTAIVPFLLAILGIYLAIESIIELTNSNHIGWISFFIGAVVMIVGILPALQKFGIGPGLFGFEIPTLVYQVIFLIEGIFLMIAMFAMEL